MRQPTWKLAVGTALLSLCACAAFGQAPDGPPPGPGPEHRGPGGRMGNPEREFEMLNHLLTLTPDQQTGVKAVLEQQAAQMKALRNKSQNAQTETTETRESMQARMSQAEAIRDETNTKITALLDENQKKTFAGWTARRKAEMEARRAHGGQPGDQPPPPPPNE